MQEKQQGFEGTTFIVKVKSRENHSWQGEITWVEEQVTKRFRSALELIKMMESAMDDEEKSDM